MIPSKESDIVSKSILLWSTLNWRRRILWVSEAGFDTDNDGIPDEWEVANGLDPNKASDAFTYTLDSKGWYTNLEVYANSLVEDIMKAGNADGESNYTEYYPAWKSPTAIHAIQTDANKSAVYYNLSGQKVNTTYKGLVICNGRKMIQK